LEKYKGMIVKMYKKNIFQLLVTMILATGIGFIIFTNHYKKDKKEEKKNGRI